MQKSTIGSINSSKNKLNSKIILIFNPTSNAYLDKHITPNLKLNSAHY